MEEKELLERTLETLVGFLKPGLELISVLCVAIGLVAAIGAAIAGAARLARHPPPAGSHLPLMQMPLTQARLRFGLWLAMALEFQLGADILATTVAPSFESLGKVAAIAVIRTFLNVFLARETAKETAEFSGSEPPESGHAGSQAGAKE